MEYQKVKARSFQTEVCHNQTEVLAQTLIYDFTKDLWYNTYISLSFTTTRKRVNFNVHLPNYHKQTVMTALISAIQHYKHQKTESKGITGTSRQDYCNIIYYHDVSVTQRKASSRLKMLQRNRREDPEQILKRSSSPTKPLKLRHLHVFRSLHFPVSPPLWRQPYWGFLTSVRTGGGGGRASSCLARLLWNRIQSGCRKQTPLYM